MLGLAIACLVVVPLIPGILAAGEPTAGEFVRIPAESVIVLLVLALLPWRAARIPVAMLFGAVVVAALLLAGIDRGYLAALGTHFDPADLQQLPEAFGVVADALGRPAAWALLGVVAVLVVGTGAVLAWAALRTDAALRARRQGPTALAAVAGAWTVSALLALQAGVVQPAAAAASVDTIGTAVARASAARAAALALERQIVDDPMAGVPASRLLGALRGKDVVLVFVESYGQVAVQGTAFSAGVDDVLRRGTAELTASGYGSRSAWLTSPTFGGISWLAHATLQTGLWIPTQTAYDQVIGSRRLTLSDAFLRAGWQTVSDVPSDAQPWPPAKTFYHDQTVLNALNTGYAGPTFGYARIPDEYTLKWFADHVLRPGHRPLFAEIDLVSSHTPWAPLPRLVPWAVAGDGTVYDSQPAQSSSAAAVWQHPETVQEFYGRSIQYSLGSVLTFLRHAHDPNLVVIALGDHQPATIVSGAGANHRVPVSIIAKDPAVLHAIAGWQWQAGLLPAPDAPLWRMDAFRDRFLAAFAAAG
ncbi:hypothetical protein LK09_18575 [Microbacterium mangrovi]|uniref:CDP-alcohol phosphatidyltransferase n=1 Tax=Microbacterium mangrovi TaxID=1348253 RepID=A0A0B2A289_9MICO|nr:hypothetical protein LK09_18575 [Microbacterium mangrovi]